MTFMPSSFSMLRVKRTGRSFKHARLDGMDVCVYVCKASIASKSSSMQLFETALYTSLQNLYGEAVDKTIDGVLSCICD